MLDGSLERLNQSSQVQRHSPFCILCRIELSPASFFVGELCSVCDAIESSLVQSPYWIRVSHEEKQKIIAEIQNKQRLMQTDDGGQR